MVKNKSWGREHGGLVFDDGDDDDNTIDLFICFHWNVWPGSGECGFGRHWCGQWNWWCQHFLPLHRGFAGSFALRLLWVPTHQLRVRKKVIFGESIGSLYYPVTRFSKASQISNIFDICVMLRYLGSEQQVRMIHLMTILFFRFGDRLITLPIFLVASNAAVGGPSTATTFAESLEFTELILPAAICGTLGYALGTPVAFEAWLFIRAAIFVVYRCFARSIIHNKANCLKCCNLMFPPLWSAFVGICFSEVLMSCLSSTWIHSRQLGQPLALQTDSFESKQKKWLPTLGGL